MALTLMLNKQFRCSRQSTLGIVSEEVAGIGMDHNLTADFDRVYTSILNHHSCVFELDMHKGFGAVDLAKLDRALDLQIRS